MASENPPKQAGITIMDRDFPFWPWRSANPMTPIITMIIPGQLAHFLVSDSYEPGSTFKIVTASAALEEGTVNVNSGFYCPGSIHVANATISCWSSVPHGSQNLPEAVRHSCNPAFVTIGQGLEAKEKGLLYKYIQAFGFGQPTGLALNGRLPVSCRRSQMSMRWKWPPFPLAGHRGHADADDHRRLRDR